jgi:hypothetical protein
LDPEKTDEQKKGVDVTFDRVVEILKAKTHPEGNIGGQVRGTGREGILPVLFKRFRKHTE